MVTMKGNEDNEVNSYFWLSAPNGNEQKEGSPRVGGGGGGGGKAIIFKCYKKMLKRDVGWQSLMDSWETFVVVVLCKTRAALF